jgi:hypothetical protein
VWKPGLEGLSKLKKKIHLIGTRTPDLPACSIFYLFEYWGMESILGPLGTAATSGLLYVFWVIVKMEKLVELMVLAGETEVLGENLPGRHFVHHKSHLPDPSANPGRRVEKSATNRFSYGAAFRLVS